MSHPTYGFDIVRVRQTQNGSEGTVSKFATQRGRADPTNVFLNLCGGKILLQYQYNFITATKFVAHSK